MGQLSLALARGRVRRSDLGLWASELRMAADDLEKLLRGDKT